MISHSDAIAAIRYGTGLRPGEPTAGSARALIDSLSAKPVKLKTPAPAGFEPRLALRVKQRELFAKRRRMVKAGGDPSTVRPEEAKLRRAFNAILGNDLRHMLERARVTPLGFSERLVLFWQDHFTVASAKQRDMVFTTDMIETAIRPHITGRFPDMLKAVAQHPAMLVYLNQVGSHGPNSTMGQKRRRGLNENLAREILELHTLGVKGSYKQRDVRQFAELLTGLTVDNEGFRFRPAMAEPGAETVLGAKYGGNGQARLGQVLGALEDIALHPDTAQHLARKLCVHFIGGTPDRAQVGQMAEAYLGSDGALIPMLEAMLAHSAAWAPELKKAKQPLDLIISTLRALDEVLPATHKMDRNALLRTVWRPLSDMGQPLFRPNGPDGWPEAPEAWITPAGLTARLLWVGGVTREYAKEVDPRAFVEAALGPLASPLLRGAAAGAETRDEGVALVLASPEFNRR